MKKTRVSGSTKISTQTKSSISTQTRVLLLVSMLLMASMGMMAAVGLTKSLKNNTILRKNAGQKSQVLNQGVFANSGSYQENFVNYLSIEELNQTLIEKGGLWQAGNNDINQKSLSDKQKLLGIKFPEDEISKSLQRSLKNINSKNNLPDFFDWRKQDGGINLVSSIKNQGGCGSCWAFATVGMMEGTYNAYYNKASNFNLSEQDFISCIKPDGCNGVSSYDLDVILRGIFNGQENITSEACFKYQTCDAAGFGSCSGGGVACSEADYCREGNQFGDQRLITIPVGDVAAIKQTLIENGPVMAGMIVYSDFFMYQGGIYQHYEGDIMGGHAVLIVGYGNYDGIDYWIVKNSWGENWGEDGYFRIKMGDASNLENMFLYAVDQPVPDDSTQISCLDNDKDGYCSWGTGKKPINCPKCAELEDCNDGEADIFEKCDVDIDANLGNLQVTAKPEYSEVYVKDLETKRFVYRGTTPLSLDLLSGERELKVVRPGYLEQVLLVNVQAHQQQSVHFEPSASGQFLAGWPVHASASFSYSSAVVGDINNDSKIEIAVVDRQGMIYVYNPDGDILPGWPRYASYWVRDYMSSIALADIDNDNFKELIVLAAAGYPYSTLKVFNFDGSLKWEANVESQNRVWGAPLIGDIDGDGELDIVLATGNKFLYAFDSNGAIKNGWPRSILDGEYNDSPSSLADLNNDGKLELILGVQYNGVSNSYYKVYVLDYAGQDIPHWPKIKDYGNYPVSESSASVADLNNDGKKDIIVSDQGNVYAYDINGNQLPGWPFTVRAWMSKELSIADLNNDGYLEIAVATFGVLEQLHVLNYMNQELPGFPVETVATGIAIANVDNDNDLEIISGGLRQNIYAWNNNGSLVAGFPIMTSSGFAGTPLVTDFNKDGKNEIILSSEDGYIYALKTNGISGSKNNWPMFQHDPYHTGSVNKDKTPPKPVDRVPSIMQE